MSNGYSRRNIFNLAGAAAAAVLARRGALAQNVNLQGEAKARPRLVTPHPAGFPVYEKRSTVAVVKGDNRRKIVQEALLAIDKEIAPKLKTKKYVLIKPNNVSGFRQPGETHADTLRGIMDYLTPRFRGPVIIGESSAGMTLKGFDNYKYPEVVKEFKNVRLVDFNTEAKYVIQPLLDFDLHVVPARLAARLFDPDAFVLCSAVLKTHNIAVVSLAVKNMVLGAPLHAAPGETPNWSDKRRYHAGIRQSLYNIYVTAQRMQPFWGAAIIDGYEGMEGNSPGGTPISTNTVLASADYIAADRVGAEIMGVNPDWLGWLKYCGESGVGQWDISKIDIQGAKIADVQKKFRLHSDIELELKWMGPMEELPPNLGWVTPVCDRFNA